MRARQTYRNKQKNQRIINVACVVFMTAAALGLGLVVMTTAALKLAGA